MFQNRIIARLFLCSKTGACYERPYNSFFNKHNNKVKIPLRVFAFRHPVVAQLKAEVNGKNCTPLRFVAFALCARLLLKTLIIPRVRLAIEFGSFFHLRNNFVHFR